MDRNIYLVLYIYNRYKYEFIIKVTCLDTIISSSLRKKEKKIIFIFIFIFFYNKDPTYIYIYMCVMIQKCKQEIVKSQFNFG